jgi:hypothetical protein
MNKNIIIISITVFNFIFPFLGFFVNSIFYLFSSLTTRQGKLIFINVAFSFAFIGYLYFRVDQSGDVYRYALSLEVFRESVSQGREAIIVNLYEAFYPVWYFLLYITSLLDLNIQFINAIAGFSIYSCILYIVYSLNDKRLVNSAQKMLYVKVFLFMSFVVIFSSYKTLWAFSLVAVGIFHLMRRKRSGYFFIFCGIGIHPVAWFPFIIFLISRLFKFKIIYLYSSIVIAILLKEFVSIFNQFLSLPFIGNKINSYIYGEWGQYRFHDNGEYIKFFILIFFVLFVFYTLFFKFIDYKDQKDEPFKGYYNFIFFYFSASLCFFSFRTIEFRLMLDGMVFFFPFFYLIFTNRKIYQKKVVSFFALFLWFILLDVRTFNFGNSSYHLGDSFPINLLSSPISIIFSELL